MERSVLVSVSSAPPVFSLSLAPFFLLISPSFPLSLAHSVSDREIRLSQDAGVEVRHGLLSLYPSPAFPVLLSGATHLFTLEPGMKGIRGSFKTRSATMASLSRHPKSRLQLGLRGFVSRPSISLFRNNRATFTEPWTKVKCFREEKKSQRGIEKKGEWEAGICVFCFFLSA